MHAEFIVRAPSAAVVTKEITPQSITLVPPWGELAACQAAPQPLAQEDDEGGEVQLHQAEDRAASACVELNSSCVYSNDEIRTR